MTANEKNNEKSQLDRIEDAISGNGREGLLDRTARIEERIVSIACLAEDAKNSSIEAAVKSEAAVTKVAETVQTLAISATKLSEALATHLGTDHLSTLIRKKSFWMLIVVGYIALHLVSTEVPSLWDALMVFLNLPKLAIPL